MPKYLSAVLLTMLFAFLMPGASVASNGEISEMSRVPASAEVVTVGFYPINVYGIDQENGIFNYDGYIWLRWSGATDPTGTLEFVNATSKWGVTKELLFEEPQVLPSGEKYQIMRVDSQFFNPLSLANFPLDQHSLSIVLEDSLRGADKLVYEIDKTDTGYNPNLDVQGWDLKGWSHKRLIADYGSNFGDKSSAQASKYAQMVFNIDIARPKSYFVWKLLLPLIIVLCGAWIALLLNPALTETRAALPASALLTTVFLQQSYTETLPETGGLVLLDQIYVIAYILIVITLARVIVKSRQVETMNELELLSLRRKDAITFVVQALIFAVATAIIVLNR